MLLSLSKATVLATSEPTLMAHLSSFGITGNFTSGVDGSVRQAYLYFPNDEGKVFYLHLYANTGGHAMSSFEVELVFNPRTCLPVPVSASPTASYTGPIQGRGGGIYRISLLNRLHVEGTGMFTKWSRFGRLPYLTSTHGYLGCIAVQLVGGGLCLESASVSFMYYQSTKPIIPGGTSVMLVGNNFRMIQQRFTTSGCLCKERWA